MFILFLTCTDDDLVKIEKLMQKNSVLEVIFIYWKLQDPSRIGD